MAENDEEYSYAPAATESPSDAVRDYFERSNRIQNPDDVVGICSECKSEVPEARLEKNIFVQSGVPSPCPYCGGVVVLTFREVINQAFLNALDRNRGIGMG